MHDVTVTRAIDAPPDAVRSAMQDLQPFTKAAGFDQVAVDGDTIHIANQVGPATIELTLDVVDHPDADLAYDQRDGIFKTMTTAYTVDPSPTGTDVVATTQFALDVALVGAVLDATVINRQRHTELSAQLDWLEDNAPDYPVDSDH